MSPFSSFTQGEAKISFYTKLGLGLAPEAFSCIQKCSIDKASSLPGGCPPLEGSGYVAGPHRKASIRSSISSDNTMGSGYASGREAERPISPESQTIGKLEMDHEQLTAHCFFTLGKMNWQLVTGGPVHASDYVVALSLYDSSLWAYTIHGTTVKRLGSQKRNQVKQRMTGSHLVDHTSQRSGDGCPD